MADRLRTGIAAIDDELGGLPDASLVQLYGPPASGKTTLGLALAGAMAPAALVLPERPHPTRIRQVLGERIERVLIARPEDLEEQDEAVDRAARLLADGRIHTCLLDSLTFLYRFERLSSTEALQTLFGQMRKLRNAARSSGAVALVTNQVRGGPEGWQAIGGPALAHASDAIVSLAVLEGDWRRLRLEKHPFSPSGAAADVRLTDEGVASVV